MGDRLLVLRIGYLASPDATEAGTTIERLGQAYASEMRGHGGSVRLVIDHLEISSLIVHLRELVEAIDDIGSILDSIERMTEFVRRVAVAIVTLQDANGGLVPSHIFSFIKAFVYPVKVGKATDAKLYVNGDNNTIIYIDGSNVNTIDFSNTRIIKSQIDVGVLGDIKTTDVVEGGESGNSKRVSADVFWSEMGWYARPVQSVVILPLAGHEVKNMKPGFLYEASGVVKYDNGEPVAFLVTHLTPARSIGAFFAPPSLMFKDVKQHGDYVTLNFHMNRHSENIFRVKRDLIENIVGGNCDSPADISQSNRNKIQDMFASIWNPEQVRQFVEANGPQAPVTITLDEHGGVA